MPTARHKLAHGGIDLADERASAFRLASMNRHGNTSGGEGPVSGNDFIDVVRGAARIELWALDGISQSRNCLTSDVVCSRTANDLPPWSAESPTVMIFRGTLFLLISVSGERLTPVQPRLRHSTKDAVIAYRRPHRDPVSTHACECMAQVEFIESYSRQNYFPIYSNRDASLLGCLLEKMNRSSEG